MRIHVKVPISLSRRAVRLSGKTGQQVSTTVEVRALLEKPLKIEVEAFDLEGKVTYEMDELEKERVYRIHLKNVTGTAQTYRGHLKLKTNYRERPELIIMVRGRFSD
jgi:hypothetical protein